MRPLLCRWEELPAKMRVPEVRPYWEVLDKKYVQLIAKRAFDVTGSAALLIVLSPIMAATAVAIKADSPGPVMYRQERVTQYGRRFRIHKFRTMVDGADKLGSLVTIGGDSRITKVGSLLRKYRLDEFPQLIDILSGDMSFVGTRPEVPKYVSRYSPEMLATLLLPAGVTSKASIAFKHEAELIADTADTDEAYEFFILPRKMEINLSSLKGFSLVKEFATIYATVVGVFGHAEP